jgi:hypothetical protein
MLQPHTSLGASDYVLATLALLTLGLEFTANILVRLSSIRNLSIMGMSGLGLVLGGRRRMQREGFSRKDFGPGVDILIFCMNRLFGYVPSFGSYPGLSSIFVVAS